MTLTLPLLPLSMSDDPSQRPWRLMGWRTWTVLLATAGLILSAIAISEAKTTQDVNRIVTTMASICGGGAFITGFLWKLVGENSLTLVRIKDELLVAQKEQHAKEIGALTTRFTAMELEMQGLKNLNIALQNKNLTLEEKLSTLESVKKAIERALSKAYEDKETLTQKANGYKEMLDLAERRIRTLSEKGTPK